MQPLKHPLMLQQKLFLELASGVFQHNMIFLHSCLNLLIFELPTTYQAHGLIEVGGFLRTPS